LKQIVKRIFLLSIFFISISTYAQDFDIDSSYLESLPDGVRNDVLSEIKGRKDQESDIYRRSSSMIKKRGSSEDVEDANIEYQDYLNYVSEQKRLRNLNVERFGLNIFDAMQSSFMPINEPNIDSSYILDYGDVVEVQLVGSEDDISISDVKRDGSISVENVGKIFLAGLSLKDASNLISTKIQNTYTGVEVFISIVGLRDIQILVSGNAYNPGIYTVSGNSNALHVLSMAGGLDKNGSYRNISVIRDGKILENIDLYDVFIGGKSNYGRRLRSGDSVLVNQTGKLVKIEGGINRPFIYELREGESYEDLINYANGYKDTADFSYIRRESLDNGKIVTTKLSVKDLPKISPHSGDSIYIGEHKYINVHISGAIKSPGLYKLSDQDTLYNIIKRAGGYLPNSYPFAAEINNKRTKEMNKFANEQVYQNLIKFLASPQVQSSSGGMDFQSIGFMLQELKNSPISGRMMAEFDINILESDSSKDTYLEDGDEIFIPSKTQQVYVFGEVNSPGAIRYSPNKDFRYYVDSKGGLNDFANNGQIFVVHPNGQTFALKNSSLFGFNGLSDDVLIYPGSVIYIPRDSTVNNTQIAAMWAPILSGLVVSLTSLSVLSD
jgi:protein involved in polysaccharide export with SLBB domain